MAGQHSTAVRIRGFSASSQWAVGAVIYGMNDRILTIFLTNGDKCYLDIQTYGSHRIIGWVISQDAVKE